MPSCLRWTDFEGIPRKEWKAWSPSKPQLSKAQHHQQRTRTKQNTRLKKISAAPENFVSKFCFGGGSKKSENVSEFPNFSLDFKIPDTFGSPEHGLGDEVRRRTIGKIRFLVSASNVLFVFFLPWVHFLVLYSVFANLAEIKPHRILH